MFSSRATKSGSIRSTRTVTAVLILAGVVVLGRGIVPLRAAAIDTIDYLSTLEYLVDPAAPDYDLQAPTRFLAPLGVAYDSSSRLYVSDTDYLDEGVTPGQDPYDASERVRVFGPRQPDGSVSYLFDLTPTSRPFLYPVGLALDADGRLLVADAGNDRIVLFGAVSNPSAPPQELAATGVHGNFDPTDEVSDDVQAGHPPLTPLTLWFPSGVAIKPGTHLATAGDPGRVAVVDNGNHRVVVLDSQLTPLYDFGGHVVGTTDAPAGFLENPWDAAIDAAGLMYVSDTGNNRIQVFQEDVDAHGHPTGAHVIRVFGSAHTPGPDGTFIFNSVASDVATPFGLNFDSKGRLLLAVPDDHRVMRIDVTRSLSASAAALLQPCSAVAPAQSENHCLMVTSDGQRYDTLVLGARGGHGDGGGDDALFLYPQAIAEAPDHGLAIGDTDNNSVQLFTASVLSASFAGPGQIDSGQRALNTPFDFYVSVANDGQLPATLTLNPQANLAGTITGDRTALVQPGESKTLAFSFRPTEPGALTLTIGATATADVLVGSAVDLGALLIDGGVIPPGIGLAVTTTPSKTPAAGVGETVSVTVHLRNTGGTALTQVGATLTPSDPTLVSLADSNAGQPDLAGLGDTDFTFSYTTLRAGTVTFTAAGSAHYVDPIDGIAKSLSTTAVPVPLNIVDDLTAPVASAVLPPLPDTGWYNAPIQVQVTATDNANGSGVKSVSWKVVQENATSTSDGSSFTFTLNRQGNTEIQYWATDNAGNVAPRRSVFVKLDSIAPDMGTPLITAARPPMNGWYNTVPTITFVAGDGGGLTSLTAPQVISTNGAGQSRTGVAVDNAGNRSREATATVNVDAIAPSLVCAPAVAANALGWYTAQGSVQVNCVAADQAGLSGLVSVSAFCQGRPASTATFAPAGTPGVGAPSGAAACALSAEGVWTVYGSATDAAGNTTTSGSFQIKIDRTAPTVTCETRSGGDIWPPNHKMVAWDTSVLVADLISGSAGFTLTGYSSSEAPDARGDGHTSVDMSGWTPGTPDTSGLVRAERTGLGEGRIYRVYYRGADAAGNAAACTVTLSVPHDQGKK